LPLINFIQKHVYVYCLRAQGATQTQFLFDIEAVNLLRRSIDLRARDATKAMTVVAVLIFDGLMDLWCGNAVFAYATTQRAKMRKERFATCIR
jgi:hypothetical protein